MSAPCNPNRIARFGIFEVDLREGALHRAGLRQKLGPQPFQVLQAMLERPAEVVTRNELRERLWPGDTFIDYDLALKKCINRIRDVLGDSVDNPRFVETVRGRGYRFIAPVDWTDGRGLDASGSSGSIAQLIDSGANGSKQNGSSATEQKQSRPFLLVGSICLALLAAGSILLFRREIEFRLWPLKQPAPAPLVLPLISLPGEQGMPAFSPDGSRVAFLWRRLQQGEAGIYVVVVGSQTVLKLSGGLTDHCPAWSPDGREVAFLRDEGNQFFVEIVSALGGTEKRIYTGVRAPFSYPGQDYGLSYSPDGRLLAFSDWNTARQEGSIRLLSLEDSSARFLTSPPPGFHDRRPTFSPDGREIAFVRSAGPSTVDELFVASLADGGLKQITEENKSIYGSPIWGKDGAEILFSSDRAALASIWRISRGGGVPRPVPGAGPIAHSPSLSPSSNELAYEHVDERQDLWRLELKDAIHPRGPASIVVSNNKTYNLMPQFSPDGRRLAFQTGRSGYSELWICDADGSHLLQVTALHGFAGSPRWSPDGRYLAFDYRPRSHSEIHVVEASGGHPHPVAAFPDADNMIPSWSRDGHWLYFSSNHNGKVFQIWKIAVMNGIAAAGSLPVQVTKNGGSASFESLDRRQLFYTKLSEAGIWAMPVGGGAENVVWHGPGPDNWSNWAPTPNGTYFVAPSGATSGIEFLDFKTKRISRIAKLEKPSFYGFTVSPDGKSIVYSQWDRSEHNILLLKNFH